MQLPKALSRWTSILKMFPEDVAVGIGEIMQHLSTVLGPINNNLIHGSEEPDGYEGISNKGEYDRLLASEWILATELPEEFLRRAVMHEHPFYKLKKQSPHQSKTIVALFDCGPMQLGMPRLVHVALSVLFQFRALGVSAEFLWGSIQHPQEGLRQLSNEADVKDLLSRRNGKIASEKLVKAWHQELLAYGDISELWLVGDIKEHAVFDRSNQIEVREIYYAGCKGLQVKSQLGDVSKKVNLELPDHDLLKRILRNPFQVNRDSLSQTGRTLDKGKTLIFSDNGKKLAVRLLDGSVAIYSVPNSPKEKLSKPKYFYEPEGQKIVALSVKRRRVLVIARDRDKLIFYRFPQNNLGDVNPQITLTQELNIGGNDGDIKHFIYDETNRAGSIWLVDDKNNLRTMSWSPKTSIFKTVYKNVMAIARTGSSLNVVYVDRQTGVARVVESVTDDSSRDAYTIDGIDPNGSAFFGKTEIWQEWNKGLIAFKKIGNSWSVHYLDRQPKELEISVDAKTEVIGVVQSDLGEDTPVSGVDKSLQIYLVGVSQDRKYFTLQGTKNLIKVKALGKVHAAVVNQMQPTIAYRTEAGDLCVYAVHRRAHVMHVVSD